MNTESNLRLVTSITVVCLLALIAEGITLWHMQDKLTQLGLTSDSDSAAVEARILAKLNDPQQPPTNFVPAPFPADPFSSIQQMQQRFDSMFGSMGFGSWNGQPGAISGFGTGTPTIKLQETPDEYQVVIDVPEDQAIDLNTSIEDNALSIEGRIKATANNNRTNFAASVFSQSQFSRTIRLPEPVDPFGLTSRATKDGIVVSIPKKPA